MYPRNLSDSAAHDGLCAGRTRSPLILLEVLEVGAVVGHEWDIGSEAAGRHPHVVQRSEPAAPLGRGREPCPLRAHLPVHRHDRDGREPAIKLCSARSSPRPNLGPLQQLAYRHEAQRDGHADQRLGDGPGELTLLKAGSSVGVENDDRQDVRRQRRDWPERWTGTPPVPPRSPIDLPGTGRDPRWMRPGEHRNAGSVPRPRAGSGRGWSSASWAGCWPALIAPSDLVAATRAHGPKRTPARSLVIDAPRQPAGGRRDPSIHASISAGSKRSR